MYSCAVCIKRVLFLLPPRLNQLVCLLGPVWLSLRMRSLWVYSQCQSVHGTGVGTDPQLTHQNTKGKFLCSWWIWGILFLSGRPAMCNCCGSSLSLEKKSAGGEASTHTGQAARGAASELASRPGQTIPHVPSTARCSVASKVPSFHPVGQLPWVSYCNSWTLTDRTVLVECPGTLGTACSVSSMLFLLTMSLCYKRWTQITVRWSNFPTVMWAEVRSLLYLQYLQLKVLTT